MIMSKDVALRAVLEFVGKSDRYDEQVNALVINDDGKYLFKNISFSISDGVGTYGKTLSVLWEEDISQPSYDKLKLHGTYSTLYDNIEIENGALTWNDGDNHITIFKV